MRVLTVSGITLALTLVAGPWPARAQGAPGGAPPEVARAQALLAAGHADSTIAILEDYFQRNPAAVLGRLLLGSAWRQKGDLDNAVATYGAITQPRQMRLQAVFAIASIQAGRGQVDEAFDSLRVLKQSGAFDMDLVDADTAFEALRADPRLAELKFHPADFERPFVEPVRVIHEWIAETKGDQFSWIARGIGDVDGDGASEIVTSAPTFGAAGRPVGPGKIYVYSGRSGRLLWSRVGSDSGESLGIGLEGAGDVDGDGAGDVIAGAPGSGKAYVYSGRDGRTLLTLSGTEQAEGFGRSASGAGDVNGDGHEDVIVGAPASNAAARGAGRAYVFSGKDGSLLLALDGEAEGDAFGSIVAGQKGGRRTSVLVGAPGGGARNTGRVYAFEAMSRVAKWSIDSDSSGAALGAMFTSMVGDVNGDRVPDIYASDFTNSANGPATGRVYVHSGADGRRLLQLTGEKAGDGFGIGSADLGDVNQDGYADLVLGAWQHSSAAPSGGKIYVYSGKDGSLLRSITGRIPGETLGFDAAGVGDIDGDGVVDLLVTSTWSNVKGFRSGRMFVISGR